MLRIEPIEVAGCEQVVRGRDEAAGLEAIIAVHSTALGPSLGGIRMHPFPSFEAALADVTRLAGAMTRKAAISELALGGGKAVVIGDPRRDKSPALLHALGELIESLEGRYICAEDAGIRPDDIDRIAERTSHVTGLSDGAGAPGPTTARTVLAGMERAVERVFGGGLSGRTVAIQGFGSVGEELAKLLRPRGARLVVADAAAENTERARGEYGARTVAPEAIHAADCDVLSPCAMGGVLNEQTIGEIRAPIVAGGANNQFLDQQRDPEALHRRGVLHAPDYVVNAGGLIRLYVMDVLGRPERDLAGYVDRVGEQADTIFDRSAAEDAPPLHVADRLADECIEAAGPPRASR